MRNFLFSFVLFVLLINSCTSKVQFERLTELSNKLYSSKTTEISDFEGIGSREYVNGLRVVSDISKVDENKEIFFLKNVLREAGIAEKDFSHYTSEMRAMGVRHYYKYLDYSLFTTGGMLGEIEGILIVNDGSLITTEFRLNENYFIYVGNEIAPNIYRFSG